MKSISTFSLVARASNGDLGVAVASKFLAVGSAVPWVTGGVGAVATQSYANTSYGPRALQAFFLVRCERVRCASLSWWVAQARVAGSLRLAVLTEVKPLLA